MCICRSINSFNGALSGYTSPVTMQSPEGYVILSQQTVVQNPEKGLSKAVEAFLLKVGNQCF